MIDIDTLRKPAKVYTIESEQRSWRTLWLKRTRARLIFYGYIRSVSHDSNGTTSFDMENEESRRRLIDSLGRRESFANSAHSQATENPKEDS